MGESPKECVTLTPATTLRISLEDSVDIRITCLRAGAGTGRRIGRRRHRGRERDLDRHPRLYPKPARMGPREPGRPRHDGALGGCVCRESGRHCHPPDGQTVRPHARSPLLTRHTRGVQAGQERGLPKPPHDGLRLSCQEGRLGEPARGQNQWKIDRCRSPPGFDPFGCHRPPQHG